MARDIDAVTFNGHRLFPGLNNMTSHLLRCHSPVLGPVLSPDILRQPGGTYLFL